MKPCATRHFPAVNDAIEMNVSARVMLLLSRLGIRDARCLSIYRGAVVSALRSSTLSRPMSSLADVEPLLSAQLDLLEDALRARLRRSLTPHDSGPEAVSEPDKAPVPPAAASGDAEALWCDASDLPPADEQPEAVVAGEDKKAQRNMKAPSGYVPSVKSMEDKLKDERKPVQKLLLEDCVQTGLIDLPTAERLIQAMTGKTSQDAERDIVEHLRQLLQVQVKSFIRKSKGGPWADPRTQEDLRKDIHAANSVRGVVMLSRQVVKEHRLWEQENGRIGILGLFSGRKRIVKS